MAEQTLPRFDDRATSSEVRTLATGEHVWVILSGWQVFGSGGYSAVGKFGGGAELIETRCEGDNFTGRKWGLVKLATPGAFARARESDFIGHGREWQYEYVAE